WDVDEWHLLYTRRTEAVESHRGQVSFPGGVIESQDNGVEAAALRETYEEIGIHADDVNILGRLDTMLTVTQFSITPVVGTIPWPYDLRINNNEVAHTFGVPISWLADPANLEFSERELPVSGQKVPVYFYHPYQGEVIWGATARITLNFLQILGMRPGK
ncbi:MAG: NUDIX domain-containing protein, partial [Anaerolineales bacterium]|nr:NUDIX domain-containing protein [Anaerolineales bacterium]